jgi:hypothetical protein
VNTVLDLRVPKNVGGFLISCTTGAFSRRAQLHEVSLQILQYNGVDKTRQLCLEFLVVGNLASSENISITKNILQHEFI